MARHMKVFISFFLFIQLFLCNPFVTPQSVNDANAVTTKHELIKNTNIYTEGKFTTVVDLLSHNVSFSIFVRILQRKKLIPYLNELYNFTLFAPINSAFVDDSISVEEDSIIEKLNLLTDFDIQNYLVHKSVITTDQLINSTVIINNNVKYPLVLSDTSSQKQTFLINNDIRIVEPDLIPNMQNAVLHGISKYISNAPKLSHLIEKVDNHTTNLSYHYFNQILQILLSKYDSNSLLNNKTILIPSDFSFESHFNPIELNYLLNRYNKLDSLEPMIRRNWYKDIEILFNNLVIDQIVGGSVDLITHNKNDKLLHIENQDKGHQLILNNKDKSINHSSNQRFDSGVAHFFDDIDFLNSSITFNAEKYLHGLNCSGFVREIYFRGLEKFIQNRNNDITVFLPQASLNDEVGFTKSTLLYHFAEVEILLERDFPALNKDEVYNRFYNSSFCSSNKKLGGNCQKLKITKSNKGYTINDKFHIMYSKPYKVGNVSIYIIDNDLSLPNELIFSLPPSLDTCSKSISFLRKLNYLELKPNHEGYTVFLPCFISWNSMGLNYKYIYTNLTAAGLILQNFILNGLYYTELQDLKVVNTTNLLNLPVSVTFNNDSDNPSNIKVNISSLQDNLIIRKNSDIIFNQGVIHPTYNVEYPRDLKISLMDLLKTSGNHKFLNLLENLPNFENIFQDSKTPFSILVPSLSSFDHSNINANYSKLEEFFKLHIIPGNETMNLLNCNNQVNTLLHEKLECKGYSPVDQYIRISNGASNEVRILNKGCSTENPQEACIFLIDKPLSLDWINKEKYNLNLPIVAVAFGIVVGVIMFMIFVCCLLMARVSKVTMINSTLDSDEAMYNNGRNNNTDGIPNVCDVENPLLSKHERERPSRYSSIGSTSRLLNVLHNSNIDKPDNVNQVNFNETAYSENSTSNPIHVSKK